MITYTTYNYFTLLDEYVLYTQAASTSLELTTRNGFIRDDYTGSLSLSMTTSAGS